MGSWHPFLDRTDGSIVLTETRANIAYLSRWLADFLLTAAADGKSAAFVTDEATTLTYPLWAALQDTDATWVVREVGGTMRDGFDGRVVQSIEDAVRGGPLKKFDPVSAGFRQRTAAKMVRLIVTVSVLHESVDDMVLGGAAEYLGRDLTGAAPQGWGVCEPAGLAWDRAAVTQFVRDRLPQETKIVLAGGVQNPIIGTLRVVRTKAGVEEITQLLIAVGTPDDEPTQLVIQRVPEALASYAAHQMPLFASAMTQVGMADGSFPSAPDAARELVGAVVGAAAAQGLGPQAAQLVQDYAVQPIGQPQATALLVRFAGSHAARWTTFDRVVAAVSTDQATAVLGQAVAAAQSWRPRSLQHRELAAVERAP